MFPCFSGSITTSGDIAVLYGGDLVQAASGRGRSGGLCQNSPLGLAQKGLSLMQAQMVKSTLQGPHTQAISAPSLAWAGSVQKRRASVAEEEDAGPSPAKKPGGSLLQRQKATAAVEAAAEQHQDASSSPAEARAAEAAAQPRAAAAAPEAVAGGSAGGGRREAPTLIDQAELLLRTGLSETSNVFVIGAVIVSVLFLLGLASIYTILGGKGVRGAAGEDNGTGADGFGSSVSAHGGRGGAGLETALAAPGGKAGPGSAALSRLHPPAAGTHLCSDLIVPRNSECVLLVPISPIGPQPFEITDALGKSVLFVGLAPETGPSKPRCVLTAADGVTLARFGPAQGHAVPEAPNAEFVVARSQGDVFAHLQRSQNQDRYTLATRLGMRLHFCGSFHLRAVNVTDDAGRLLATTEPSAELSVERQDSKRHQHYLLRVAPLMDVGLVLCGLLCIAGGARQR